MNIQRFAVATGKFVTIKNEIKEVDSSLVAVDATDGLQFDCKEYSNDRLMFIIENSATSAKKASIKAPTKGGYAAEDVDLELSIAAGKKAVAYVETARYANTDGSIVITGASADIKAVAVYLG